MTSEDLKRFYELYFEKKLRIHGFSVEFSKEVGYNAEVEFFKDDTREVIKSDEEDFARALLRFQKIVDMDGSTKFARIKDSGKYFEAMKDFGEDRETKISKALEDLKTGKFPLKGGFWHKVDRALVKLLFEKTSVYDSDLLWLKAKYFHIFAYYLAEAKGITGFGQKEIVGKHKDSQQVTTNAEEILREAFLSQQESRNPVEIYRKYRQFLPDSLEDHSERVAMQLVFLNDLRMMLNKAGSQEESVRILYILEVYRRLYEMTLPILKLLYVALLLIKGEKPNVCDVSATTIIRVLNENDYGDLVNAINPQIRHCESHLATRIREGRRSVLLTKRKGLRRLPIHEFSYEEIVSQMRHLYDVVFPALYHAFTIFDGFLKIMLMDSYEYQLLLISKTTV
jgi:hypothetical protein